MIDCKRNFPRIPASFPVKYEVVKWNESPHHPHNPMTAECHDLSVRGMRFSHSLELTDRTLKKLREGSMKLNLEFTLPNDGLPINLLGRMIYCGEDDGKEEDKEGEDVEEDVDNKCMGILFIDIDRSDYQRIDQFIQSGTSGKK